jgi:hypothetical protein
MAGALKDSSHVTKIKFAKPDQAKDASQIARNAEKDTSRRCHASATN